MKKIVLILNLCICIYSNAQQATDTIHKVNLFKQPYNGANGGCAWLGIGATAMFIGGTCQYISTNPNMPFTNKAFLNQELINTEKTQKTLNTVFGVGVGIAGLSVILAHYDFGYYFTHHWKKSTVKLNTTPNGIGLCLNFK